MKRWRSCSRRLAGLQSGPDRLLVHQLLPGADVGDGVSTGGRPIPARVHGEVSYSAADSPAVRLTSTMLLGYLINAY